MEQNEERKSRYSGTLLSFSREKQWMTTDSLVFMNDRRKHSTWQQHTTKYTILSEENEEQQKKVGSRKNARKSKAFKKNTVYLIYTKK